MALTPRARRHGLAMALPEIWTWRARQESNPRPDGPKPSALSAELRARASRSIRAEWFTSYPAGDLTREESLPRGSIMAAE